MRQILRKAGVPVAVLTAVTAVAAGGVGAASAREAAPECAGVSGAECGTIQVPLVRSRPDLGRTTVAYAVIRHRDTSRPAKGTVTVNPGGPGDSALAYAPMYAEKFRDLLRDHDMLLVEPRGVGRSGSVDCGFGDALPATRDGLVRAAGACGEALGERARGYTTAETADDIDAVRARLGIGGLDLLGESYGTYLMTVYAQRHPQRVRSIVLSSAYPVDFDMWARPNVRAARRTLKLVCDRSGACDGDRVLRDVARLSARLGERPIPYELENGERRSLDATALSAIVYGAATAAPEGIGTVPAMVRDALRGRTAALVGAARELAPMSGSSAPAEEPFNPAQSMAVMCNDYPALWDRAAPVAARLRQFQAGRAALPERDFWPFGKQAWTSAITDRGNTCLRWPDRHGTGQAAGPVPDVPVLVVSGDLDPNTPTEEGRLAARRFPRSTVVEVPNVGHVAEKEPSGCVAGIETGFIRAQKPGDTSCLAAIPAVPVAS
ncbi:alpha/beta fold hydrolase [Actinomadura graeca]|uniref:Alpha/beta fold hydrolase n=1 Tax=Actinomadura graeca TaxID=2750812 RepID=A0ABX8QY46_9ACTN|nr:alpha/beta fold hydrolase [Actinomadura graeca]QXJ23261.1 alpha/beta fold hydrolase [Actinomadura graeca]